MIRILCPLLASHLVYIWCGRLKEIKLDSLSISITAGSVFFLYSFTFIYLFLVIPSSYPHIGKFHQYYILNQYQGQNNPMNWLMDWDLIKARISSQFACSWDNWSRPQRVFNLKAYPPCLGWQPCSQSTFCNGSSSFGFTISWEDKSWPKRVF